MFDGLGNACRDAEFIVKFLILYAMRPVVRMQRHAFLPRRIGNHIKYFVKGIRYIINFSIRVRLIAFLYEHQIKRKVTLIKA